MRYVKLHACYKKMGDFYNFPLDFPTAGCLHHSPPSNAAMLRIHCGRSVNLLQQMLMRMGNMTKMQKKNKTANKNHDINQLKNYWTLLLPLTVKKAKLRYPWNNTENIKLKLSIWGGRLFNECVRSEWHHISNTAKYCENTTPWRIPRPKQTCPFGSRT